MPQTAEAYEIVEAKNDLRKKVRERRGSSGDDPVTRAEAALKILSSHFEDWVGEEVKSIEAAHKAWADSGFADGEPRAAFFRMVHDLKGQATTLGFPLATRVAGSLCALLDGLPDRNSLPMDLVQQHVLAIRAIYREKVRDENDRVGAALASTLSDVSQAYLREHAPKTDDPADGLF